MIDNIVIKVLNKEHGKKVKEYFNSIGIKTGDYKFSVTEDNKCDYIYYGLIDGIFGNYKLENLKSHVKIITLPEKTTFPRLMYVWDDDNSQKTKRIVLHIIQDKRCVHPVIAVSDLGHCKNIDDFNKLHRFYINKWQNCEEIEKENPLIEEFNILQNKIKELQMKANEIQSKL